MVKRHLLQLDDGDTLIDLEHQAGTEHLAVQIESDRAGRPITMRLGRDDAEALAAWLLDRAPELGDAWPGSLSGLAFAEPRPSASLSPDSSNLGHGRPQ